MKKPTHRLISMRSENTKRIDLVDMKFSGGALILTGKNYQGKSSFCDSIVYGLEGKGKHPPVPIRTGQKAADTTITIEETATRARLIVHRRWTPKSCTLDIRPAPGAKPLESPQAILDNIVGRIAFDPCKFARMRPSEQRDVLIDLLGVREQIREIKARRKVLFDERTLSNRRGKNLKAVLASLVVPEEGLPEERLSNEKVIAGIQAAQAVTKANDAIRADVQKSASSLKHARDTLDVASETKADLVRRLKEIRDHVATLELNVGESQIALKACRNAAEKLEDPDTTELSEKLTEIAGINSKIEDAAKYRDTEAEMKAANTASGELDNDIEKCDQEEIDLIKGADLPLPELGIHDDYVTYEGLPLEQAGGAKNMHVSLNIAIALNPKLGFLILEEVGGLDSDELRVICETAEKAGYDLLMTRPDYDGEIPHVVISEGRIVDGEFEVKDEESEKLDD